MHARLLIVFLPVQFSCCGFVNATDWVMLNLEAITTNRGRPPMCLDCAAGEGDCDTFYYPISVAGVNGTASFNTTSAVRQTKVGCLKSIFHVCVTVGL